jgi:hypothetical protein
MKSIIAIAAVGLVSFGFASSASAAKAGFKFSPASTKFTATGPTSATLNGTTLACTGKLSGATNKAGAGTVTGGSFTGALGCSSVTFTGTPWKMTATTATTATIAGVEFTTPLGSCGPANLVVTLKAGTFTYNGKFDQCSNITLTLKTTPTLSIVAK